MLRVCSLLALTLAGPASAADLSGRAQVIDGDTLALATSGGRAMIRLHGIDAPESAQECLAADGADSACGAAATHALERLVGDATLRCQPLDMDRHDRIVARCHAGARDLGAEMVEQGAAFAYARYSADYLAAEGRARQARRGLWAGRAQRPEAFRLAHRPEPAPAPSDCAIKGNISSNGRIYHLPGGRFYDRTGIDLAQGERWFCTTAEAEAAGWRAAQG